MTKPSSAYLLAETLFYTFRGETDLLTEDELNDSGVVIRTGHMTNVEGVVAFGEKDGVPVSQRLSLGKTGMYYLSTVHGNPGGSYEREHIIQSSEKGVGVLETSFFMNALTTALDKRKN